MMTLAEIIAPFGWSFFKLGDEFRHTMQIAPQYAGAQDAERGHWIGWLGEDLVRARWLCEHVPLPISVTAQIGRIEAIQARDGHTITELASALDELRKRIEDELENRYFYAIGIEDHRYFPVDQKQPPFGQAVFDRFSSANDDIAEAGACIGFNLGTAAVFHLMRVMEVGLRALSRSLGIPYAPSWESHISQITSRIEDVKHKHKPNEWKKLEPFYKDVLGDLTSVKLAWRNPTMHISKPFAVDRAKVIYSAVEAFMRRLADELSEVADATGEQVP